MRNQFIIAVNRSRRIDSMLSLDLASKISDSRAMIKQQYYLYTERSDPARKMARYYVLEISRNLFGEPCLIRRWGKIGARGQALIHHFGREDDAVRLFLALALRKRARGYRPKPRRPQRTDCT